MSRGRRGYGYGYSSKKKGRSRLVILTLMLGLCIFLKVFAQFYWVFDLFSHFVLQYTIVGVVLCVALLIRGKWVYAMLAFLLASSQAYQLRPLIEKEDETQIAKSENITFMQFNVNRNNSDNIGNITDWIISKSQDVDIVVLFEVNERWDSALAKLKWVYPYNFSRDMRGDRSTVILSKLFISEMEIKTLGKEGTPAVVLRGETSNYHLPFVLYGIHPPPPVFPSFAQTRNELFKNVAENIAQEKPQYKMVIADFNSTRYSPSFKEMAKVSGLRDSNEDKGFNLTWPSFLPAFARIAIDNILLSDNINVVKKEVGPGLGSDHLPVISTLEFKVQ